MATLFRIISALVCWIGLGLFFYTAVEHASGAALIHNIINYFSYFTILSNILVALALSLSCIGSKSRMVSYFARPGVRTAIALYILVTGLVYLFILSRQSSPQGIKYAANILLHYVTPVLYIVDWAILVPKGTLRIRRILPWLAIPLVYAAYTLIHGWLTGFYPYPFTDVKALGYSRVLVNFVFLLGGFSVLGGLLVAVDRLMGGFRLDRLRKLGD